MGRVTFQDPAVSKRVGDDFVATWKNYATGYVGQALDATQADTLVKTWKDGTASENISTLVSTPEGEVIHEILGYVKPSEYLRELDFAVSAGKAVEAAGTDPEARARALRLAHAKHLADMSYSERREKARPVVLRALDAYSAREADAAGWKKARAGLAQNGTVAL